MKYLLILVLLAQTTFASDSYVFLVDTSGSMAEPMAFKGADSKNYQSSRMNVAKNSLNEVIKSISEDSNVGILTFDGWVYSSKFNKEEIVKAIDSMEPSGGTPLGEYMKHGADKLLQLRKEGDRGGTYSLIIVTDGEANDSKKVDQYLPEIISRGLVVKAIGLDMAKTHSLATKVNEYTNANDPTSLTSSLKEYVAEASFEDKNLEEEVFEEIKSIPDEVAYGVIQTMTDQPNHPIGEMPEKVQLNNTSNAVNNTSNTVNNTSSKTSSNGMGVFFWIVGGVVFFVIVISLLANLFGND
jgi:hypothetical protein